MELTTALTFDDVLLVPQFSNIGSRSQVSLKTKLGHLDLTLPLVSANMDTVTGPEMALKMGQLGGLGVLHRYEKPETVAEWIKTLKMAGVPAVPSVGVKPDEPVRQYLDAGADAICIDVAHGHSASVLLMVKLCRVLGVKTIIAGNVATAEGAFDLFNEGADVVKVGVGPGSLCTTRVQTGHGMPQLTAILECAKIARKNGRQLIADGGIRNSGDIVKALAAGADAVMIGSLFAGTTETPGKLETVLRGGKYVQGKKYRGMASRDAQVDFRGRVNNDTPEGETTTVEWRGTVAGVVQQLTGGIRSGLSYSGVDNIKDLHDNAKMVRVTQAGWLEGTPHGLKTS